MLTAPGTLSTASSTGSRTSSRNAPFVASQWASGMSPRRTSAATIPAKFTGSFALPNWRRVAELGLLEVVDRRAHLDRHGERADPLVHRRPVLAERLRAEEASVGLAEETFSPSILAPG